MSTFHHIRLAEKVGFEPTERFYPSTVFKTVALNQLSHFSIIKELAEGMGFKPMERFYPSLV
jgi:hypothetical protein